MMKKAYICAHANFPRNGAEANYIYSLAKCLQTIGYKVMIISRGHNRKEDWCEAEQSYVYREVHYDNVGERPPKFWGSFFGYFYESRKIINKLRKNSVSKVDCVILYSINFFYIRDIYKYAKRKGIMLYTCIVEYPQSFQYKGGKFNPVFWLERLGFRHGIPINRKVIVISQYLQSYFRKLNCKTFILPPLVDFDEYKAEVCKRGETEFCNIIYSGNPSGKDDMNVMAHAILRANKKNKGKIRFHITGCNVETLKRISNLTSAEWDDLKNYICVYPWMEYEELIKFYWSMDFLLLARHKNMVTLSNFPSKVPELMACGIIPIVSEVGDYTSLYIRDQYNGIVFQNCTIEECAEAIERAVQLTEEKKKVLSKNARMMVKDKLDYHVWGERIEDFL